ncbi:hypothetical protein SUGI_0175160 [Cryptomeria japonica]|nr:hypothetical protein SUGI_0175160 [Cryptomeria japonica]
MEYVLDIFRDLPDLYRDSSDTWVRTTDFTRSSSIGQSSSVCFALPHGGNISQIQRNFAHYKEIEEQFSLESGTSFSSTSLVPILSPPVELNVPFEILFKVNSLVQNGLLCGPNLSTEFFKLLHPKWFPSNYISWALVQLNNLRNTCYDPAKLIKKEYESPKKFRHLGRHTVPLNAYLDEGLMCVYRVQVTPSKVYFFGPEINVSNRVTRQYAEHINDFLRVNFVDENWNRLYSNDLSPRVRNGVERRTKLYKRILTVLKEGIVIGSKKFEFLAFSSSQLRESSVWFFASNGKVNGRSIREWMGDFWSIRNVAKCAARMGQSFSSSTETLHVSQYEIQNIPDIRIERGIGGYKGVVAVDPRSPYKLSLRPSMKKYESKNSNLDVLSWTKFRPCYLNRQIITLLSTLGVGDENFEKMQGEVVKNLDQILTNRAVALEYLQFMTVGDSHNALVSMLSAGYLPNSEPYLSMLLHAFRATQLFELRCKAHIFVAKGACLMGCLDETRTLKYGEVFIHVPRTPGNKRFLDSGLIAAQKWTIDSGTSIVEGKVVVAKNPCLHPGDVRVLSAVNIPNLHHMIDCIVFPQQGQLPHPDECSGSDLDGDLYFVSWDASLIPSQQDKPMDYAAKPDELLDHAVTIEEIQEYFVNYMVNDTLGIISNRYTVYADLESRMARSPICLELAKLFSTAVDFPKTGIPAHIPAYLTPKCYPDFMEKEDKPMYESKRIIGKLYRSIKEVATEALFINSFTRQVAEKAYDKDMEVLGFENYLEEALMCKNWYDSRLAILMYHYGVKYEAEIVSGNIFSLSKLRGSRLGDLKETIMTEIKTLKKQARSWFDDGESSSNGDKFAKASAWGRLKPFLSFAPEHDGHGGMISEDGMPLPPNSSTPSTFNIGVILSFFHLKVNGVWRAIKDAIQVTM